MKFPTLSVSLATLLGFCVLAPVHAQHEHEGHTAPAAAAVDPAQRFDTDAALREGMSRINAALDDLRHYEMGHMPEAIAVEKVGEIKSAIVYLFANCKLPSDADAALHAILAPLMVGEQAFAKDPKDMAAIVAMRDAVNDYPHRFKDPNWPLPGDAGSHPGH